MRLFKLFVVFFYSVFFLLGVFCTQMVAQEALVQNEESTAFPKALYAVHLDQQPSRILATLEIAGRLYVEPIALAEALNCDLHTEGVIAQLITKHHVVVFAADAHCVAVRERLSNTARGSNSLQIAQMLRPVALHSGQMLLPFDDVLRLLADNGIYEVDERDADIFLTSFGEEPNTEDSKNSLIIVKKSQPEAIPMGLPSSSSQNSSQTPAQSSSSQNQPATEQQISAPKNFVKPTRNVYILPRDVKRREMDSLPEKTSLHGDSKRSSDMPLSVQVLVSRLFAQTVKKKSSSNEQPSKGKQSSASGDKNTAQSAVQNSTQSENDFSSAKKKWALDVIVLDAGHGGKDAGAIGVTKAKEKDVTLGIVKKLGAMLKKSLPGTKIVYTRTDDTFVELDRRGQIANENGGKLFVSIHCNSTPKKPSKANGFEVYILRPGRNEDAVRVAEMENAVIKLEDNPKRYKPLTDEQFIVVSMAQSSFVKYSDMAAAMISAEVKKMREIGVRGVNQAGFLVLVGASMPNMLIETGFLSNKKDEEFLKSERGQSLMASAICRAIKAYRLRYENQISGQAKMQAASTVTSAPSANSKSPTKPATKTVTKPVTKPATKSASKDSSHDVKKKSTTAKTGTYSSSKTTQK